MRPVVLFDLDGTLTDSQPGIEKGIRYALEKLDRDPTVDLSWAIGPSLFKIFPRLLGSDDPKVIDRAVELYREKYVGDGLMYNCDLYEGIGDILEQLSSQGRTLFVATAKPWKYARPIVEHFGLSKHFRKVYGSELGGERTDKVHLIKYILDEEGLAPADVVMIGDREFDVVGAKKNGAAAIGALWGYGSHDELSTAGADAIAHEPVQLREFLIDEASV